MEGAKLVPQNRIVLITGSARGIGFEMGKRFAESGAKVILTDKDSAAVEQSAEQLRLSGLDAQGIKLDVTSEAEIAETIHRIDFEQGRLDILINNAGMQYVAPIEDFPTEKFEQMIKIMITAPFLTTI